MPRLHLIDALKVLGSTSAVKQLFFWNRLLYRILTAWRRNAISLLFGRSYPVSHSFDHRSVRGLLLLLDVVLDKPCRRVHRRRIRPYGDTSVSQHESAVGSTLVVKDRSGA